MRRPFSSHSKAAEFEITSLLSPGGKSGLSCLSETTWELAYNLILFYGYWRGRYYFVDPDTGDQLTLEDEEWTTITNVVDLALEELQMTGCSDLVDAVNNLVAQVGLINTNIQLTASASGCCTSYGTIDPDAAPDLGDPETDPPPDGFDTWAEYYDYKCRAANKIADDWIGTIGNLATLSGILGAIGAIALAAFLQTSLLSGLLVGLMALGFSAATAAAIIIGALITLILGEIGLLAYFADLASDMEADKESLVCDLFEAQSVEAAKSVVITFTSDLAAGLTYDPGDDDALFQAQLATIADALFNNTVLNKLFEPDEEIASYVGDIDCDACGEPLPCEWIIAPTAAGVTIPGGGPVGSGTVTNDGEEFVLNSVQDASGIHRLIIMRQAHLSHPDYPAAPTLSTDCDCGDGPYSLTNISGLPSNPTLSSRGCVSGSIGAISWPGTGQTSTTAYWMSIARSTGAGGAFSISLRINP